jgi:hypothetical protein
VFLGKSLHNSGDRQRRRGTSRLEAATPRADAATSAVNLKFLQFMRQTRTNAKPH